VNQSARILFILKFREGYDGKPSYSGGQYFSSGLYWSAKFVVDMLVDAGIDAKLVQVTDNNDIDREVHNFRPTIVIIEALWVVPQKFDILKKLHPSVKWIVRLHSNVPFLAQEGVAVEWIKEYTKRDVKIASNEIRALEDIRTITGKTPIYLPNYYPLQKETARKHGEMRRLHIGCYGAIRPLKNQLIQAVAAIRFADDTDRTLFFHVNATRVESGGNPVLENLRALFAKTRHYLVEDAWMSHEKFLERLRHLDIGMQVSLSETFSIVAADMVNVGIPIVVSHEIDWASFISKVDATNSRKISAGLNLAEILATINVERNRHGLKKANKKSKKDWLEFLK